MNKTLSVVRWCAAIAALLLAAALCYGCLSIYFEGGSPVFTRENAALALKNAAYFAVPLILFGALGAVLGRKYGKPAQSGLRPDARYILKMAQSSAPQKSYAVKRLEKLELLVKAGAAVAVALLGVMPARFLFNRKANFSSWELEDMMLNTVRGVLPYALVAILVVALTLYALDRLALEQAEALKGAKRGKVDEAPAKDRGALITALRFIILALALLFIVFGALNGGAKDVLIKAIAICTECIGLG